MKTLLISSYALLWLGLAIVHAAPGDLDTTFGTGGKVTTPIGSSTDWGVSLVLQSDGKLIESGYSIVGTTYDFSLVRFTSTGALDTSFGTGGKVFTDFGGLDDIAEGTALQSDGKIIVVGRSDNGDDDDFAVVRYTASGALDTDFGTGGRVITQIGTFDDSAHEVAIQSDGKIVVAGQSLGIGWDFAVVRYTSNGALDTSFGTGGKVTTDFAARSDRAYTMAIQNDGKIIVAGYTNNGSNEDFAVVRYTSNGVLDTSFGTGGIVSTPIGTGNDWGYDVALQSDGKIIVAGYSRISGTDDFALVRYLSDGSLDNSFNGTGKVTTAIGSSDDRGRTVTVQGDGKIVVGGSSYSGGLSDFALARYSLSGALDTTFSGDGKLTTQVGATDDFAHDIAVQTDGEIVAGGYSSTGGNNDFALVRYLGDAPPTVAVSAVNSVGTTNATLNGTANPNGLASTAQFEYGLTTGYGSTASVTLSPADGTSAQNVSANLTGLTPGTLYHYRLTATNTAGTSNTSDGTFTTLSNNANLSALTLSSGTLSPSFAAATISYTASVSLSTTSITVTPTREQANATITVNGGATVSGTASAPISLTVGNNAIPIIVTAQDGTTTKTYTVTVTRAAVAGPGDRDFSFGTQGIATAPIGSSSDYGQAVAVQADGKTVVAGFIDSATINDFAVARFNADGTPDASFGTGGKVTTDFAGNSDLGRAVAIQPDGKIVVAGQSYNAAGTQRYFAVARYNTNGSLDDGSVNDLTPGDSFGTSGKAVPPLMGSGIDNGYAVLIQMDGKIVVAGSTLNVTNHNFALVRLNTTGTLDSGFGTGGKATPLDFAGSDDLGLAVALQSDGKIVVAGHAHNGSNYDIAAARWMPNGTLDTTFNSGAGKVTTPVGTAGEGAFAVAVQPDDRIVLGGWSTNASGVNDFCLVRYLTGGGLDGSFGTGGKKTLSLSTGNDTAYGLALQRDGKLILAGRADNGSNNDFALARFNSDGGLDTGFNGTGMVITPIGSADDQGQAVALGSDGSIIVAGFAFNGSNYDFALVRYLGGPLLPAVQMTPTTAITATTARLNGAVNPNGAVTVAKCEYGITASYGSEVSIPLSPNNGTSLQGFATDLTSLLPATLYHARVVATNVNGTSYGMDVVFRTSDPGGMSHATGWPVTAPVPSTAAQDSGTGVVVDAAGNVAVVGYVADNSGDYFTAKYSPAGTLIWQKTYDNPTYHGEDRAYGIACDASGNVIVTGYTYRGPQGSGGTAIDIYTIKYAAADGAVLWSRHYNNASANSDDRGYRVLVDGDGDVIINGYTFRASSNQDYYTAKYAGATGAVLWEVSYNGPANSSDISSATVLDPSGNVIVTGYSFNGTNNDYHTVKYAASNGALLWERRYNGPANHADIATAVAVDAAGNVLVTGYSWNGTSYDSYTAKYATANGALLWERRYDGPASREDYGNAIAVDSAGNVFVTGNSEDSSGLNDYFTAKYAAADGTAIWEQRYNGPTNGHDVALALVLAPNGDVFVTGYSWAADADYLTLRYRGADGAMLSSTRTQGAGSGGDSPAGGQRGIALLASGYPVVTGLSTGTSGGFDILTVAYAGPPVVVTQAATNFTPFTATLNGTVNPAGLAASAWFEYGTTTSYGTSTTAQNIGSGLSASAVTANLTGLTANTLYHARLVAQNADGITYGNDIIFTTLSNNANLANLAPSAGTLSPTFSGGTTSYTASVSNTTTSITVTPTVADSTATVKVNGVTVASGSASGAIALAVGDNTITTVVTAQDGTTTKAYTVIVTRQPFAIVFNAASDVPVTASSYTATGITVSLTLNFAPTTGVTLKVVNNTGTGFISGVFSNLAQGQIVALLYNGVTYNFVANYYGGTGNDLVLIWANTRAMAWGNGDLGDNTTNASLVPSNVNAAGVLFGKTITAAATGAGHSLVLCSDGTLAAWGFNYYGTLGNSSTTNSLIPVAVTATGALAGKRVIAVAAGNSHSLALSSDGTVAAWGAAADGQLGNNSGTQRNAPVAVNTTGALAGKTVTAIAAGEFHSLALCSNGTVAGWGRNFDGELGNNSTLDAFVPVSVNTSGVLAGKTVIAVAAGGYHSLALCSDGTIASWGRNDYGQLGNNSLTQSNIPAVVSTVGALFGKTVTAIAAGEFHSVAMCSDGTLVAWGHNDSGQVGNNSTVDSLVPVVVNSAGVLAGKEVVAITAGNGHSMALCTDGTLAAWGNNGIGQLGNNSTTHSSVPVMVTTSSLAVGERFTMGICGPTAQRSIGLVAAPPAAFTALQNWRQQYFGITTNTGIAADSFDYDKDGLVNLLEWACNLNPTTASVLPITTVRNGAFFEFTYTRSLAALNAGAAFIVEWSDTLPGTSWSSVGVTEQLLSNNGTVQQVKALVPVGSQGRRFAHLSVTAPP